MRVFLIGGTRFLGPAVVRVLVARGPEVTIYHRGQTEADLPAEVVHLHDERQRLREHLADLRSRSPDVVVDLAPFTEDDARAVAEAVRDLAPRLVAISSQDVYRAYGRLWGREIGPPDPVPLTEDAPLREQLYPLKGAYPGGDTYDKLLVERVVLGQPGLAGTILRLPMVYGPADGHRIFPYLKRMDDGRNAIILAADQATWRWSRAYLENVAEAVVLATTDARAAGQAYNVSEPAASSEAEWVRRIGDVVGWTGEVVIVPPGRLPTPKHPLDFRHDLVVSDQRLRVELGFREVVPAAEGLRRTIAWERAHPPNQVDPAEFDYAAEDRLLRNRS